MKEIFLVDIDNTICKTIGNNYSISKPIFRKINVLNKLHLKGHVIIFFTSRFMGRNHENTKKAKLQGFNLTKKQLKKWGCKYDKLIFGKPSHTISIDDKSLFFSKKWDEKLIKRFL